MVEERDPEPVRTWIEVGVETDGEGAEAVSELFNRYGTGGAVLTTDFSHVQTALDDSEGAGVVSVRTYIPAGREGDEAKRRLEAGLWHLSQLYPLPQATFRVLPYEDWASAWKAHFPVLHIGGRLVIRPPWLEYRPRCGEVMIELEPGMAFGTGLHPTTRMCLLAMEELVRPGMRVLDLGTGSGILAIFAGKLGAASVLAMDIDPVPVSVARANVVANGVVDLVQVKEGTLDSVDTDPWHLILANISAQTIKALLEEGLVQHLAPAGELVAGGIIRQQLSGVESAFASQGLTISDCRQEGDWVTLIGHA
jgi:ribosomal protein L11 methyltransferase